jgi:hypothetical protein
MAPDEKDFETIRSLSTAELEWLVLPIPERFIASKIPAATDQRPKFHGSPYGDRAKWLKLPELKDLLVYQPSSDNNSSIPSDFDSLHAEACKYLNHSSLSLEDRYACYLDILRRLRSKAYAAFMEDLRKGCAVVSLPAYGKIYTGIVYEGMASGRPVIAQEHPRNHMQNKLIEKGKDILLYPRNDPSVLGGHIRKVLENPDFAAEVAARAADKMRLHHTTEMCVRQILDWLETGEPIQFGDLSSEKVEPSQNPIDKPSPGGKGTKSLKDIFIHQVDRESIKWSHYFNVYETIFSALRDRPLKLLEIGIFRGGSLSMWDKYFPRGRIFGLDIDPACSGFADENVTVFVGDRNDKTFLRDVMKQIDGVDIVIDDGGYTMEQQINSFETIFPYVNNGGIYIIEHMHTSYNAEYQGGLRWQGTAIE